MGSRSDLRTRSITDKILCDTLKQKLTYLLEFLWLVMYFLAKVSSSELVVGAVLGDNLSHRIPSLPLL